MTQRFILHAPNVHTGGGLVLLKSLLQAWQEQGPLMAYLDARVQETLQPPPNGEVYWVQPTITGRLQAERHLRRASRAGDKLLCFHGLPPLLPVQGHVAVFLQNRNLLGLSPLRDFGLRTGLRLGLERLVCRLFQPRVHEYLVQTPSMAELVRHWLRRKAGRVDTPVRVLPFADLPEPLAGTDPERIDPPEWDFIYPADGESHKNHLRLLEAWRVLGVRGLRPSLALTLGPRDQALVRLVETYRTEHGVRVHDLGQRPHAEVLGLYRRSGALVFPSLGESFGLPLVEAKRCGLPIVASELDFVRDVCEPAQTFDPKSPQSIARAVERFLGMATPGTQLHTPAEFLAALRGGA
ncbi:MAG: glycosyltransferase [Ramlibacter sp.]|uniref:glycosyltransferase n=1 Tax=Ramlibacter sp. TaxID=1917967 RepID=UPI002619495C|nr:glycosyltransferase [Ramlibacter sp.]MDH4377723.1 glycosyltransferase [Ramlibacter sp.]